MAEVEDLRKRIQELEAEVSRVTLERQGYLQNLESLVRARTEQLQRTMADLERSYDTTIQALGYALGLKESSVQGHSRRVCVFTMAIAQAMGLERAQIAVIAQGAFLHDLGKLAISDAILSKPGKLVPEEMAVMREHPRRGYEILKTIPYLAGACEIVYAHHEHYDGSGYPRGLTGEQIPFGARITAVANTFDSITSDLPYREAAGLSEARKEIERWSGKQFDPDVVKVFLGMPDRIWENLRRQSRD